MSFSMPTGCVRFTRCCGEMYSKHLFSYAQLQGGRRGVVCSDGEYQPSDTSVACR